MSKLLVGACLAALLLPAALPADAKSPPNGLKHQVAVLKAKVRRLKAENRSLEQANAAALRRERLYGHLSRGC